MGKEMERTWDGLPITKEPPYGTAVVVYRREAAGIRYLVLHRKHCGPDYAGDWAWGAPAGARLPGEPVDECARRELREETGLALPCIRTDFGTEDWLVYCAEAPPDARVVLSDEHDQYRWLPAREAAALCLPTFVGEQLLGVARMLEDPDLVA